MTEKDGMEILNEVVKGQPEFSVIVITEVQRVESFFGKLIPSNVIVTPSSLKITNVGNVLQRHLAITDKFVSNMYYRLF